MARDHFVPQFHLRRFIDPADGERLWLYAVGERGPYNKAPRHVARKANYYDVETSPGVVDPSLDRVVNQYIESNAAEAIQRVMDDKPFEQADREWIATFMALQSMRVPAYREAVMGTIKGFYFDSIRDVVADPVQFSEVTQRLIDEGKFSLGTMTMEEFRVDMQDSLRDPSAWSMESDYSLVSYSYLEELTNIFFQRTWAILEAGGKAKFVTSDNPVVAVNPRAEKSWGYGIHQLRDPDYEITFAVSPELAIVLTSSDSRFQAR
jgi:hypothetical protein